MYPQKLKMGLPFDPAIALLRPYPKNPEAAIQKEKLYIHISMFIAVLFKMAKIWKQLK